MAQTIVLRNNPAYKEGSLLGYDLNSQSRFNPVPITLSRDSEAYVEKNGVLTRVNPEVPRIDSDGALLVEPQRTNVLSYSEDFTDAFWTAEEITLTSGISAPDGTNNAFRINETTANSNHRLFETSNRTFTAGQKAAPKIFLKYGNVRYVRLTIGMVASNPTLLDRSITVDLQNGTIEQDTSYEATAKIESLADGWYEVSFVMDAPSATVSNKYSVAHLDASKNVLYAGDTANFTYVFGAQLEQDVSYSSSYIKTEGATATRSADVVSQTGLANLLGDSEGTLYFEGSFSEDGRISLSDGTLNNRAILFSISGNLNGLLVVGGTNTGNFGSTAINYETNYKIALKYAANDFALWINGIEVGTNTTSATFAASTLTNVEFNTGDGTNSPFYGLTKALAVYDTALDNTELANITTNGI